MQPRSLLTLVDRVAHPHAPHDPEQSLRFSGLVLGAVALAYWFTGWPLPRLTSSNPNLNFYVAQPVIWLGVAAVAYYGWRRLAGRPPFDRALMLVAFGAGVFHVAVLVFGGVMAGFGKSPVAGKLINYPKNLLFVVTLLIGVETARAYLYRAWAQRDEEWAFVLVGLVFWAVSIPAAQWATVDSVGAYQRIVGGRWIPALAVSFLATWLVRMGGPGPSFGYRFALLAFEWFSPEVPNLTWSALLAIGVLAPVTAAWLVVRIRADLLADAVSDEEPPEEKGRRWIGWAATGAVGLLIVLFWSGAFGVKPVVVDGISMEPAYRRGDVAVVRTDPDPADLAVDDVITYRRGGIVVIHRILSIEETPHGRVFTTQGDNVVRPDPPIGEESVEGKVVLRLPVIGRFSLWLRDLF